MPERSRVAVLISGRGTNMAALAFAAQQPGCPFEIALIASDHADAVGLSIASAQGVPTWAQDVPKGGRAGFEAALDEVLAAHRIDLIALAGYMRVLSADFVTRWQDRILNIHPSLLPLHKGLDTHARALAAGDAEHGCSIHVVTPELDDGPVLAQVRVAVLPDDTPDTLAARVQVAEHMLYAPTLARYAARYRDADWLLERVRGLALALPGSEERPSHGSPGWRSKGKYFAHFMDRHHGVDAVAVLVRTDSQDEMYALIEADADQWFRPAYYGASGWVALRLDRRGVDWDEVAQWLARSHASVATKKR